MDVTCERCGTEYEFDETLLSGRGTSVKCTNCGHVFKVYPKARKDADRSTSTWRLMRADGSIDAIDSLRELQRRIAAGELTPADQISRGEEAWKPLGSIPELETFFGTLDEQPGAESAPQSPPPPASDSDSPTRRRPRQPTLLGVVPVPKATPQEEGPTTTAEPQKASATESQSDHAEPDSNTPNKADASLQLPESDDTAEQQPQGRESLRLPEAPRASSSKDIEDAEFEEPPAGRGRSTPPPAYFDDDDDIPELPGRGWSPTRWLMLVVIVGGLALIGSQWERVLDLVGGSDKKHGAAVSAQQGDAALAADHLVAYQTAIAAYAQSLETDDDEDPAILVKLSRAHALVAQAIKDNASGSQELSAASSHAKDALNYAERALMVNPQTLEARLAEADALRVSGKTKSARESLERGRLMPFSRTPEFFRIDSLLLAAEHEGQLSKGLLSAKQAAESAPGVIRYRLLLARAELAGGNWVGAQREAEAVLGVDPDHPDAIIILAEAEEAQHRVGTAVDAGTEDAGAAGGEPTADAGSKGEAADETAIEEAEKAAVAEAPAVKQATEAEQKEVAQEATKKATSTGAKKPRKATPATKPRASRPRKQPAYDEYDRLAKAAGSDAFVDGRPPVKDFGWYMREGEAALAGRDFTKARALFESALEVRPGSGDATDALGRVAYASGDYDLSLRYFRSAAQRGHPDGYYSLGQAYERLGKNDEAVSAYYTYLKRRPSGTHVEAARSAIKKLEPRVKLPEPAGEAPKPEPEAKSP